MKQPATTTNNSAVIAFPTSSEPLTPAEAEQFRQQVRHFGGLIADTHPITRPPNRYPSVLRQAWEEAVSAAHVWIAQTSEPVRAIRWLAERNPRQWPPALCLAAFRAVSGYFYKRLRLVSEDAAYFAKREDGEHSTTTGECYDALLGEADRLAYVTDRCRRLRQLARLQGAGAYSGARGYVAAVRQMIDEAEGYAREVITSEREPRTVPLALEQRTDYRSLGRRSLPDGRRNLPRVAALERTRSLNRFVSLVADPKLDPKQALAEAFNLKLSQFARLMIDDRARRNPEAVARWPDDLKEAAIAPVLAWIANQSDPEETVWRLAADLGVIKWPLELRRAARAEIAKVLVVLTSRTVDETALRASVAEAFASVGKCAA